MRHDLIYILNAHCLNEWILNLTFQHAACLKKDFCTVIDMFISIINHMSRSISSNFSFLQLALSKISIMKYQPQEILSIDMSLAPVCFYLMIQQVGCQQQELTTKVALRTTKKWYNYRNIWSNKEASFYQKIYETTLIQFHETIITKTKLPKYISAMNENLT